MLGIALGLWFMQTAPSAGCPASPEAAVQAVMERDAAYRRAWAGPDVGAMSDAMADGWTVTHANGRRQNKAEFLNAISTRRVRFLSTRLDDILVRPFGAAAILTARSHNQIAFGGKISEGDVRLIAVYVCRRGKWQVAAEQATGIEVPPPAGRPAAGGRNPGN